MNGLLWSFIIAGSIIGFFGLIALIMINGQNTRIGQWILHLFIGDDKKIKDQLMTQLESPKQSARQTESLKQEQIVSSPKIEESVKQETIVPSPKIEQLLKSVEPVKSVEQDNTGPLKSVESMKSVEQDNKGPLVMPNTIDISPENAPELNEFPEAPKDIDVPDSPNLSGGCGCSETKGGCGCAKIYDLSTTELE